MIIIASSSPLSIVELAMASTSANLASIVTSQHRLNPLLDSAQRSSSHSMKHSEYGPCTDKGIMTNARDAELTAKALGVAADKVLKT